jgi:hypothetical protein
MLVLSASSCNYIKKEGGISLDNDNLTLQNAVFNHGRDSPYKIYIEENGGNILYLVLTDDYNGNCLLLREHLLDEPRIFNKHGLNSAYYENSEIDLYLNNGFLKTLSPAVKDKIADSTITITAKESIGVCGTKTQSITRQVFLLSYTEVGGAKSSTNVSEGIALKYFDSKNSLVAKTASGEISSWWLRTPNTWYYNVVCAVTADGVIGMTSVGGTEGDYVNGVRPAFCLSQDTEIVKNGEFYSLK